MDDYRYSPVKCFETFSNVTAAIHVAIDDLKNKYGIKGIEEPVICTAENTAFEQLALFGTVQKFGANTLCPAAIGMG